MAGLNFRDFLIYRYANADLAGKNDPVAKLATQLLHDKDTEALSWSSPAGQYHALMSYCESRPQYNWCLHYLGRGCHLFNAEIEAAWIEYDAWLCELKQT